MILFSPCAHRQFVAQRWRLTCAAALAMSLCDRPWRQAQPTSQPSMIAASDAAAGWAAAIAYELDVDAGDIENDHYDQREIHQAVHDNQNPGVAPLLNDIGTDERSGHDK